MSYMGKDPDVPGSVGELLSGRLPYTYLEHELVEYAEAMEAALQAIDGILEIDQLRARVAELESGIKVVSIGLGFSLCYADGVVPRQDIKKQQNELDELLNRTPAQSLAKHDAAVLRGACRRYIEDGGTRAGTLWFEGEADRIEQEAGV